MAKGSLKVRVGARGLRRGDKGENVRLLQVRLTELGYEPGFADGTFGFMTEDALLAFQRDYRLRPDGIAGPEVWNALRSDLPKRRVVHVVRHGERLSDIADRHQVGVHALRWMNNITGRRRLRTGDRLVIRSSYVLASIAAGVSPRVLERNVLAHRRLITSIAFPPLMVKEDGTLFAGVDPKEKESFITLVREGGWPLFLTVRGDERPLAEVACRRRALARLLDEVAGAMRETGAKGLVVDLGPIPAGRGGRVLSAIARLAQGLAASHIVAVVDAPLGGWRSILFDLDLEAVARVVGHVVIGAHHWERLIDRRGDSPSKERLERIVAPMARQIPPWKLLLGVPMNAWALTREGTCETLGYRAAVTDGYRHGIRSQKDANGYFTLDFPPESTGRYARIVAPTRDVIGRYLAAAHRFRLDGVYLSGVGEEDRRLWDVCVQRLKAVRGE